ncbi:uncharacterized protein LOC114657616 isoform X4 [Erpetoichthys calabaricus]|uniref:uncharacterized protein LOC114657616 isoform X4 n=1 Tax=Erpetoichthys calabaricus TaxID=27687 RepID=UPI00223403E9|nr:uncharacterized protein LOC114657616 isoform X4 [Erpetoichthys calabaricus]
MWGYKLSCTACSHRLSGAGLYRTVRRVLDTDGWYFMATEYLECRRCKKKVAGWSQDILDQLHCTHRDQFPAILTYRLSCDKKLIGQMRERTLGNGATRLRKYLLEQHGNTWLERSRLFMFAVTKFITPGAEPPATPPLLPRMTPVPGTKWLLSIYAREVASRLEETKAQITSIFGSILKMDSTKKVIDIAIPSLSPPFLPSFLPAYRHSPFHRSGDQETRWCRSRNGSLGDQRGERARPDLDQRPHCSRGRWPASSMWTETAVPTGDPTRCPSYSTSGISWWCGSTCGT